MSTGVVSQAQERGVWGLLEAEKCQAGLRAWPEPCRIHCAVATDADLQGGGFELKPAKLIAPRWSSPASGDGLVLCGADAGDRTRSAPHGLAAAGNR